MEKETLDKRVSFVHLYPTSRRIASLRIAALRIASPRCASQRTASPWRRRLLTRGSPSCICVRLRSATHRTASQRAATLRTATQRFAMEKETRGVGLRHIGQPREQFIPLEAAYRSIKNKARDARERLDAAPLDQFSDPVDSQMRWAQSRRLKLIEDAGDTGLHETRRYFKSNPEPPQYPTPKPPADPPRRQYRSNPDLWKPPSQEQ